jgi:hypothetical protein
MATKVAHPKLDVQLHNQKPEKLAYNQHKLARRYSNQNLPVRGNTSITGQGQAGHGGRCKSEQHAYGQLVMQAECSAEVASKPLLIIIVRRR